MSKPDHPMKEIVRERMKEYFIWCPECQTPTFFRRGDIAPRTCMACDKSFFCILATDSSTNKDLLKTASMSDRTKEMLNDRYAAGPCGGR